MKPFTLQTVLKFRKQMVDMAVNRLAEEEQKKALLISEVHEIEKRYNNLISSLTERQNSGMAVDELIRYEDHIMYLKEQIEELKEKIIAADEHVMRAKSHVLNKSKEKQIMEKLRDRQNLAWKLHLEKKETAQLDEIAVMSHDKKQ